ncbi:unnamed protein product [Rotaria sp. Silwood2]|nr:unnamed protein product [Rotaria sp. Silwood2]CAF2701864.1 unnamed protein product [Rotaria sp. Silwood2]CAF4005821.1 unnamed protein product [Rotaria sp. Silwood2]CAF4112167.1 unnamed protein product [Rotaria sp. Silwood2]CAF4205199.1 unnamed protein product [Rotaria sp. Silwood2]
MMTIERGEMLASAEVNSEPSEDINHTFKKYRTSAPSAYSIEEITARRRGKRVEDEKLPKRVRSFYKKQDKLISTLERAHRLNSNKDSDNEAEEGEGEEEGKKSNTKSIDEPKRRRKRISLYTNISLLVNIFLLIVKVIAAFISHSLSVISSVVDSGVDLASSVILLWATRAIKRRDPFMYPQGRTRLEPISIVVLSVIMCSASVQVISESLQTTVNDIKMLRKYPSNSSEYVHPINMTTIPVIIMGATIVLKLLLFILCSRETSETLNALAQDHRNDVFSNSIALICGIFGFLARKNPVRFPASLVLTDSIGAIVISIYILITWVRQANHQIKRLTGHTANPEFLQQITWIAFNHSSLILKIDTVRAFHFGTNCLVEVDIVLPEDMSLKEAHDIGEELQKKIESIPEVERAFVHLDYECNHKASDEHKVV